MISIAIDGPSGSGKSTLANTLAEKLGFVHLDTGAIYRTVALYVIEKGVLKTLLYNLETAKKAGVTSTGNASRAGYSSPVATSPYGFCIEAGEYSDDELLGLCGNGIYITELKGLHAGADASTGDFSIESAGFVVENGKVTRPVHSFTVAGNFFELLKTVDGVADNVKMGHPSTHVIAAPDILVRGLAVAGE